MAMRNNDNTIMMRVNDVIPSTRDGNTVKAVINAKICNDNEYDVDPSATSFATRAGRPAVRPFITAGKESWAKAGVTPIRHIIISTKQLRAAAGHNIKLTCCIFASPALKFFNKGGTLSRRRIQPFTASLLCRFLG